MEKTTWLNTGCKRRVSYSAFFFPFYRWSLDNISKRTVKRLNRGLTKFFLIQWKWWVSQEVSQQLYEESDDSDKKYTTELFSNPLFNIECFHDQSMLTLLSHHWLEDSFFYVINKGIIPWFFSTAYKFIRYIDESRKLTKRSFHEALKVVIRLWTREVYCFIWKF